ncbi:DUF202 domain-containing protein [Vibrio scophthalmi]|uniref:DUF202 domain-containing protein n=1 Tax=Vibrio scophthalmi TaxID=45658 RepID=A0A1C7F9S0_9VIBR|nr:hypothetical protein VSVS05_01036 [Vibrio scophthalmi]
MSERISEGIVRDIGLQRERSQLAWTRSSLVFTSVCLLILKLGGLSIAGVLALFFGWWLCLSQCIKRRMLIAQVVEVVGRKELLRKAWLAGCVAILAITFLLMRVFTNT